MPGYALSHQGEQLLMIRGPEKVLQVCVYDPLSS
jgi:hypothetical protein